VLPRLPEDRMFDKRELVELMELDIGVVRFRYLFDIMLLFTAKARTALTRRPRMSTNPIS